MPPRCPTLKERMTDALKEYNRHHSGETILWETIAEICAKVAGSRISRCPKCSRAMVGEPGQEKCEACG